MIPLSYRLSDRKLFIDEEEALLVRLIFERYLALGSIPALQRELLDKNLRTRTRKLAAGNVIGNILPANGALSHILKNRMYLGEINHKGESFKAEHAPIVESELFEAVQQKLKANLNRRDLREAALTLC